MRPDRPGRRPECGGQMTGGSAGGQTASRPPAAGSAGVEIARFRRRSNRQPSACGRIGRRSNRAIWPAGGRTAGPLSACGRIDSLGSARSGRSAAALVASVSGQRSKHSGQSTAVKAQRSKHSGQSTAVKAQRSKHSGQSTAVGCGQSTAVKAQRSGVVKAQRSKHSGQNKVVKARGYARPPSAARGPSRPSNRVIWRQLA